MVMKKIALIIPVLAMFLTSCGTVCNLAGGIVHPDREPRVYGGFIRDVEIIDAVVSAPPVVDIRRGDPRGAALIAAAIISVAAVDPILSLAADTLTLPVTIPLQERRIAREKESNPAASSRPVPPANRPNSSVSDTSQEPAR